MAVAPPDLSGMGAFPLLQIVGTLGVLGLGMLMWIVGEKRGKDQPKAVADVHIDGPLRAALRELERMAKSFENATISRQEINELRDDISRKFGKVYERLDEHKQSADQQIDSLRDHIHRVEVDVARGRSSPRGR